MFGRFGMVAAVVLAADDEALCEAKAEVAKADESGSV